jgi:hypothetical protein
MTIIVESILRCKVLRLDERFQKKWFWLDVFFKTCQYIIIEEKFTKILIFFQSNVHNLICKNV